MKNHYSKFLSVFILFGLLFGLIPGISRAQSGNNCDSVAILSCGTSVTSTTKGGGNNYTIANYTCHSSNNKFNAEDKVYKITPVKTGQHEIRLTNVTKDLDIFLLSGSCTNGTCIGKSTLSNNSNETILVNLTEGNNYYLAVDGYDTSQVGPFTLTLSCPVTEPCEAFLTELVCGNIDTASTVGQSNKYTKANYSSCQNYNQSFNGGDIAFKYKHTAANPNAIVTIWGYSKDLDLFIVNSCGSSAKCVRQAINKQQSLERISFSGLEYGDYFIVVDGYDTNQVSKFFISVSCQKVCKADSTIPKLACGVSVAGTTVNGKNAISKYTVDESFEFTGPESYYTFKAPASDTYKIDLTGFANDLELFVASHLNCVEEPAAIAKSVKSPGQPESIKLFMQKDQVIYIIVDGSFGAKGQYTLKINCPVSTQIGKIIFDMDSVCGAKSTTVNIPVRVKGFKDVISFSMTLQVDNVNIAQIKKIASSTLSGLNYNIIDSNKTITVTYLGNNAITLADSSIAFTIESKLVGNPGQTTKIKFLNAPTALKAATVINGQNVLASVETEGGYACVNAPEPNNKLTFDIDSICDFKDKAIVIPVRVKNFKNIRSFAMSITVDNINIFKLDSIKTPLNLSFSYFEFTTNKTFTLQMLSNNGITLNDHDIVFNLYGRLVGSLGQMTKIKCTNEPTAIQAATIENNVTTLVPVETIYGVACIYEAQLVQLKGKVIDRLNAGIKSAMVKLSGFVTDTVVTPSNGAFGFAKLNSTGNYVISVMKNENARNGIDVLDLALLQDHIIARKTITDPYKIIAADVNKDGVIDILDLAELQDLIISRISLYRNNSSWLFIPTDDTLTVAKSLSRTYKTTRTVNSPAVDKNNLDFYGIKIGDIDQSANGQNLTKNILEIRNDVVDFSIQIPSVQATKDQIIYLPVLFDKFNNVRVFQFTIQWDTSKLECLGIENINPALGGFDCNNILLDTQNPGIINSLWLNTDNLSLPDHTKMFVVKYQVKADPGEVIPVAFKDVKALEVNGIAGAEAIDSKVTVSNVSTRIHSLYPAPVKTYPNPAADRINISGLNPFDIISLINVNGVHYPLNLKYNKEYSLDLNNYPSGVYILNTKQQNQMYSQKIVIIK